MGPKKKKILIFFCILIINVSLFFIGELRIISKYKLVDVPCAANDIEKRTLIKNKDIKYIKIPKESLSSNIILNEDLIIGKYAYADSNINEGSFFFNNFVDDILEMNDIDYINLDDSKTIFELFTNNVNLNAAHLNKNMYVDLFLTIEKPLVYSDLLISGVKICGLYSNDNKELNINDERSNNLSIVSLIVDKDMVSILNKASHLGEISLIPCSNPYEERDSYIKREGDLINYLN